jgi:hemoglobin-like flavoprotein
MNILYNICKEIKVYHENVNLKAGHHWIMKEAILMTLQEVLETEFENSTKWAFVKAYKIIRNLMMGFDPDEVLDKNKKMTLLKKCIVQRSWKLLKKYPLEVSGPLLYRKMFELFPHALEYFPFKDQKNYLGSAIVKKQAAGVVGVIGRAIE